MVTGVLDLQCEPGLGGWLRYLPRAQPHSPCSPHGAARVVPASHQGLQVLPALDVLLFAAEVRLDGFATHGQRILAEGKLCEVLLVNKSLKQDQECLGGEGLGPAAVEAYTRIKICFSLTKFTKHKR